MDGGTMEGERKQEHYCSELQNVTTRNVWFFDILFMSKYMELMSQLKIYDFQLTKIQTSKNHRHKLIM